MDNYKILYYQLFSDITDNIEWLQTKCHQPISQTLTEEIEQLQQIQKNAEDRFMQQSEN